MAETPAWEYKVQTFGSIMRVIKDEDFEATLNQWGEQGWEVVSAHGIEGSYKIRVIARRPLTDALRRRRSMPV